MRILLLGGGGREHAIAWKLAQSSKLERLDVAPGNAGIDQLSAKCRRVPLAITVPSDVVKYVKEQQIDMTIIGPEAPLATGVPDALRQNNHLVFGPDQLAAALETSKARAKKFMHRWDLPTAESRTFTDLADALNFIEKAPWPLVVKASGLAAGKGVVIPTNAEVAKKAVIDMMANEQFGDAGREVVIEERLSGHEISLLCFCDGERIAVLPTTRDHKRLMEGDLGPNTGGMGAYAPVPDVTKAQITEWTKTILKPTVAGLKAQGTPYIGVLYAGLMLTSSGPKVLEFNCRFGDPEAQALLPLLESDLVDLCLDCARGSLKPETVVWKDAVSATIVLASAGYPTQPHRAIPITAIPEFEPESSTQIFHAGTKMVDEQLMTNGGRVLSVSGQGATLRSALENAYSVIENVQFEGQQYRRDIGRSSMTGSGSQQ